MSELSATSKTVNSPPPKNKPNAPLFSDPIDIHGHGANLRSASINGPSFETNPLPITKKLSNYALSVSLSGRRRISFVRIYKSFVVSMTKDLGVIPFLSVV